MTHRFKTLAALLAAAGLAAVSGQARALDTPSGQVTIETVFIEVGAGVSRARGEIGVDFDDPFLNDVSESFSNTRGFVGFGVAAPGPRIGGSRLVVGAHGRVYFEPELFDVDFNVPTGQVRMTGRNAVSFTPYIGIDIPLREALREAESRSLLRVFAGPTIADQKLSGEADDGFNRERFSESDVTVSPTVGLELVMTNVIVRDGQTLLLGGLRTDVKARVEATFPQGVPSLGDIPLLGAVFRQQRDAELSAELVIMITPRLVD